MATFADSGPRNSCSHVRQPLVFGQFALSDHLVVRCPGLLNLDVASLVSFDSSIIAGLSEGGWNQSVSS